jgi:spore coat protein H
MNAPRHGRSSLRAIGLSVGLGFAAALSAADRAAQEQAADRLFSHVDPVAHLSIEVSEDDLDVLRTSRSAKNSRVRPEVTATIKEGSNVFTQVALHLKGAGGSFQPVDAKPALTLHFNETVKGQRFHGLEKISLNNSAQDPTYLSEHIGRLVFTSAGLPAPRVTHATVSLNGRRLGLYVLVEGWNKQFLRRHFPDPEGALFEPPFRTDVTGSLDLKSGDSAEGLRALGAVESALSERTPSARWSALGQALDRDRFMTGLALEVLLSHWDGYARNQNNYRLFHDRLSNRIVFLPHGMDQLFALRRPDTELPLLPEFRGHVARVVMETRAGREQFFDRANGLLTNACRAEPLTAEVRRLEGRIRRALADTPAARAQFDAQLPVLLRRIRERHARMLDELSTADGARLFLHTNSARLNGWRFRRGDRGADAPAATSSELRIPGGDTGARARWETTVLLEPGQYRFEARAEIKGLPSRMAGNAAVLTLRGTAGRDARQLFGADGRTSLTHTFTLAEARTVTLSCEFYGPAGVVSIDRSSLQLTRVSE